MVILEARANDLLFMGMKKRSAGAVRQPMLH